jgi:glycosyltransferase involved in cell wall biosynthesis
VLRTAGWFQNLAFTRSELQVFKNKFADGMGSKDLKQPGTMAEWHVITSEYPPQPGGVSDYTRQVAAGLASVGDAVHVWCPSREQRSEIRDQTSGVEERNAGELVVHRELGSFAPADLRRAGRMLDQFESPRRLLVQWVPHGYGYRAMNVPFCLWLWNRSRKGDTVEVMAHECFLPYKRWALKQNIAALVQRLMTMILLRAARRVWVSIPAWEGRWRPFAFGRRVPFAWLPVPSNIAVVDDPAGVSMIRAHFGVNGGPLLGHFGTYGRHDRKMLKATLSLLLQSDSGAQVILMGRNSLETRDELVRDRPQLGDVIHATGSLKSEELSLHLSACDVLLQPYQDGVNTRRGSVMAGLAHGRPIVTTAGWLTERVWSKSRAVVLASDKDAAAITGETVRLLGNEAERERLSIAARTLYREKFDVRHVIAALRREKAAVGQG